MSLCLSILKQLIEYYDFESTTSEKKNNNCIDFLYFQCKYLPRRLLPVSEK